MSLELKDSLEVKTLLGTSQIQLLLGDITKLEEKVDFIFTSAFIETYTCKGGTLIGSLKDNLNIDVHELASNKDVDLRSQFSCWFSMPLDDSLPYRRLVCFEQTATDGVEKQLSRLFRAMMPIFSNRDTTVITPVLATGIQGRSITHVLPMMVKAASKWIKAGLSLKCLKIVLFSSDTTKPTKKDKSCVEIFAKLKNKIMKAEKKKAQAVPPKRYDVCLSYNKKDDDFAQVVVKTLQDLDPELSVYSKTFVFKQDTIWQKHIHQVIANSKRVVPLLTPDYIEDVECLEQFNMALCCNRLKRAETLMPFYMKTCEVIPSYMSLVQYIECRPGDDTTSLVKKAVQLVIESLSHANDEMNIVSEQSTNTNTASTSKDNGMDTRKKKEKKFDIFISYSHQHKEDPMRFFEILKSRNPDLEVFIDSHELQAGNLWLKRLYDAIENTYCFVAFLTQGYVASSVCNEEFNIATARHFSKDAFLLLPIHTGVIDKVPKCFSYFPCVDLKDETNGLEMLVSKIEEMLPKVKAKTKGADMKCLRSKMEELRKKQFQERFCLETGNVVRNTKTTQDFKVAGSVMFLFAEDCLKLAAIMSAIMKKFAPELVSHLQPYSFLDRPKQLESADMVVVFVSDQFVSSHTLLEALHSVLCRQRNVMDSTVVYLIESEHRVSKPCYLHSLPYSLCLDDNHWKRLEHTSVNRSPQPYTVAADGMQGTYRCKAFQNLALTAASHDVIYQLSLRSAASVTTTCKWICDPLIIDKTHKMKQHQWVLTQGRPITHKHNPISKQGSGSSIPFIIINMANVENEVKGIQDGSVPVNEHIISLSSVGLMLSKNTSQQHTEPKPATIIEMALGSIHATSGASNAAITGKESDNGIGSQITMDKEDGNLNPLQTADEDDMEDNSEPITYHISLKDDETQSITPQQTENISHIERCKESVQLQEKYVGVGVTNVSRKSRKGGSKLCHLL